MWLVVLMKCMMLNDVVLVLNRFVLGLGVVVVNVLDYSVVSMVVVCDGMVLGCVIVLMWVLNVVCVVVWVLGVLSVVFDVLVKCVILLWYSLMSVLMKLCVSSLFVYENVVFMWLFGCLMMFSFSVNMM